jgi:hypothetical protein
MSIFLFNVLNTCIVLCKKNTFPLATNKGFYLFPLDAAAERD